MEPTGNLLWYHKWSSQILSTLDPFFSVSASLKKARNNTYDMVRWFEKSLLLSAPHKSTGRDDLPLSPSRVHWLCRIPRVRLACWETALTHITRRKDLTRPYWHVRRWCEDTNNNKQGRMLLRGRETNARCSICSRYLPALLGENSTARYLIRWADARWVREHSASSCFLERESWRGNHPVGGSLHSSTCFLARTTSIQIYTGVCPPFSAYTHT
jgi:hypothetical protein